METTTQEAKMTDEAKTPEQIALAAHWGEGRRYKDVDAHHDALLEKWANERLQAEEDAWYAARGADPDFLDKSNNHQRGETS